MFTFSKKIQIGNNSTLSHTYTLSQKVVKVQNFLRLLKFVRNIETLPVIELMKQKGGGKGDSD